MLDWLKRKATPDPSEQLLQSEAPAPLKDERLGRLLGRLGSDGRPPGEAVAEAPDKIAPLPGPGGLSAKALAPGPLNEVDSPPRTASAAEAPAAEAVNEVDSPPRSGAGDRFPPRREDLTIT